MNKIFCPGSVAMGIIVASPFYTTSIFGPGCEAVWCIVASPSFTAYHWATLIALQKRLVYPAQPLTGFTTAVRVGTVTCESIVWYSNEIYSKALMKTYSHNPDGGFGPVGG